MRDFLTAIGFLTILPVKAKISNKLSGVICFFPLVGLLIAGLSLAPVFLFKNYWPQLEALLIMTILSVVTGGLHLDGFADVFDSFGARDKEKKFLIMKDSRLGSYGVISLILLLAFKFVVLQRIVELGLFMGFCQVIVISRFIQVFMVGTMKYPTDKEDGMAKNFIDSIGYKHILIAFILTVLIVCPLSVINGTILLFSGLIVAIMMRTFFLKYLGGITGDAVGMTSEFVETLLYFVLTASHLSS